MGGTEAVLCLTLLAVGQVAMAQGDYPLARARLEKALAEYREDGNRWNIAQTLNSLGDLARLEGEYTRAAQLYGESLALFRETNAKGDILATLHNLGHVALAQGDHKRARTLFEESLALHRDVGNKLGIAEGLAGLAGVDALESQVPAAPVEEGAHEQSSKALRAARLFGAADVLRGAKGAPVWPAERADYDRNIAIARAQLDEQTWQKAWQEGRTMTMEEAIKHALLAS
jgi:tetratricopeptide (TPR) repeat protein